MSNSGKKGALPTSAMPIKPKVIGGVRYTVARLCWWDLLEQLELAELVLGPALMDVAKNISLGDPGAIMDSIGGTGPVAEAVLGIIRRTASDDGKLMIRNHGKQTVVCPGGREVRLVHDGDASNLDTWFGQHPDHFIEWLMFCLEVQFWDFFCTPGLRVRDWLEEQGIIEKKKDPKDQSPSAPDENSSYQTDSE